MDTAEKVRPRDARIKYMYIYVYVHRCERKRDKNTKKAEPEARGTGGRRLRVTTQAHAQEGCPDPGKVGVVIR